MRSTCGVYTTEERATHIGVPVSIARPVLDACVSVGRRVDDWDYLHDHRLSDSQQQTSTVRRVDSWTVGQSDSRTVCARIVDVVVGQSTVDALTC
jgi:hypothetical protein